MKVRLATMILFAILLIAMNNLQAQENDTIVVENAFFKEGNIPYIDLGYIDTISLQFVSISEKQFLNFKTHQPDSNYNFSINSAPFTI